MLTLDRAVYLVLGLLILLLKAAKTAELGGSESRWAAWLERAAKQKL